MFSRFRSEPNSQAGKSAIEFSFLTHSDNRWGRPVLTAGEQTWFVDHIDQLPEEVFFQYVLNILAARVRSHFLIHAGVVSYQGKGLILAAESRFGKTTLVLELLRRGYQFLSDHLAPIGRSDCRVYPFPRRLGVRVGTLALTGQPETEWTGLEWQDRRLVDIEDLFPGSLGEAVPVEQIVFLQAGQTAESQPEDGVEREGAVGL